MIAATTASFPQLAGNCLDLVQIITILFGAAKVAQGARSISRGLYDEGIASIIAGFLCCVTVPIIRLMASWMGISI